MNYLNEFDPVAAAWLRELRDAGLIPPCDIDTRSIEDVTPNDLRGYTQCHFFAGIGGWPLALQLAGWPADRPIWTGSCPCQPFSAAGKNNGFADERHLWPAFHWLIEQRRPAIVVGEQVASAAVGPWIDLVLTDLEALGYASGAYAGPAAGVGAPHIRDRSYWVAHANGGAGRQGRADIRGRTAGSDAQSRAGLGSGCVFGGLADACSQGPFSGPYAGVYSGQESAGSRNEQLERPRATGRLADDQLQQRPNRQSGVGLADDTQGRKQGPAAVAGLRSDMSADPLHGFWEGADWLGCRDGKWRPVEPGTQPLVARISGELVRGGDQSALLNAKASSEARVMRLRGYGNSIVPQQAAQFVQALMEYQACSPN